MILAFDWETSKKPTFLPWQPGSYGVSLHVAVAAGTTKTWLFNHPENTTSIRDSIKEIQKYLDSADVIIAHNAKFDLHWLMKYGITFENTNVYCTLLAEYIIDGHATRMEALSLDDLALKYGHAPKLDKVKEYWDAGYNTDEVPANILIEYGEWDATLALRIYQQQQEKLDSLKLQKLVDLDMQALKCCQEMEWNGMLLDVPTLETLFKEHEIALKALDEYIATYLGIEHISSKDQLSCGLFGGTYLVDGRVPGKREGTMKNGKIPITIEGAGFKPDPEWAVKKEGFYSTAVDVLAALKCRTKQQKEIKAKLIERSRKDQLQKTYFKGLLKRVGEDGYVHPSINQTITKTSRLSCSNPNLQNVPRGDTGPVKKVFISRY
jgi:DNA polymerase-1